MIANLGLEYLRTLKELDLIPLKEYADIKEEILYAIRFYNYEALIEVAKQLRENLASVAADLEQY